MASPPHKTLGDISGKWVMNKTLSDEVDPILKLQGVGWFLRRVVSLATVTLTLNQYIDDKSITHIDVKQVATGGITTFEFRTLDWTFRDHQDHVFGKVKLRSRWVELADVDDDFLKIGWDDLEGKHVQTWAESTTNAWVANQIWGFEIIDGQRYYVCRLVLRNGENRISARLVYNFQN